MTFQKTQVICVYIDEAHACDEWPLGTIECVKKPKTQEERISIAQYFVDKYQLKIPLLVDNMKNSFDSVYAAWPERWYILRLGDGRIHKIGYPNTEFGYDRREVKRWLETLEEREN